MAKASQSKKVQPAAWADNEDILGDAPAPRTTRLKAVPAKRVKKPTTKGNTAGGDDVAGERGIWLSIHQFCREAKRDRENVTKKVLLMNLRSVKGPTGQPMYALGQLMEAVFFRNEKGEFDHDALDPFRRKAHYAGELDKLNLMTKAKDLLPRTLHEQTLAALFKVVSHFCDTLPDVLERDCGLNPAALKSVEERLDAAREDLYKTVNNTSELQEKQNAVELRKLA